MNEYQSYLKIISWEDFFGICKYKVKIMKRVHCSALGDKDIKYCEVCDKSTMLQCPIWKNLRNFYGSNVWKKIKQEEDLNGRCNQDQRQEIAKEYKKNFRRRSPIHGRFKQEIF